MLTEGEAIVAAEKATNPFNHYHCVYWVFTQLCNDFCTHCYNNSGPQGTRMSLEDCLAVVENLPDHLDQIILSGGEPLTEKKILYAILDAIQAKYGHKTVVTLQFNGDLLTPKILDTLISKGVDRFSVASIDRYHKKQGKFLSKLIQMYESRGIKPKNDFPELRKGGDDYPRTYGFFGATEDMWLGGNWARGRAVTNDTWKKDGRHNFCAIHSGAISFLNPEGKKVMQEISIQLYAINPCCPGTHDAMGDARTEKVADVLQRMSQSPVMQKLNEGDIYGVGESIGISADEGFERAMKLGNVCMWCDEFFSKHFDMKTQTPKNPQ